MLASAPDLLRLLVVPVFAWAAWRDVRTRRLPNRLWPPLYAFGGLLLVWELWIRWPLVGFDRLFLIRVAVSLGIVAPLGYVFWRLGGFGGADAKALIAIAIVFPTFPTYVLPASVPLVPALPALPLAEPHLGVFSLTVLTNTVLLGALYPLALTLRNAVAGRRSPVMFLARPVPVGDLPGLHGRLFETPAGYTRRGLDLDALRMYLRWRGLTLAQLRENPERCRDPASVTGTYEPTDGATHVGPATDGGRVDDDNAETGIDCESDDIGRGIENELDDAGNDVFDPATADDDPWAAERFLSEIEGSAYGTDPETLREGLEVVAHEEAVWMSPGMPFIVPMFLGLVVALIYGDVLFAVLLALGWV